jgi:hypothetical protein
MDEGKNDMMHRTIDYRREDGRLTANRCVTISNPNMLFIIGTGVNPGIRS